MCSPCELIRYVLQSVSSKIMSSSPRKTGNFVDLDGPLSIYEYSYSNFSYIDPRIKLYLWDKFIPTNEDIHAFLRADMIVKNITSDVTFPGFFVFTSERIYIMKITKEEKGDPCTWLEKHEIVNLEKVKSIEPVYYKQGISIECVDRPPSNNRFKYLLLLHGRERTTNFLSFIRKSEILSTDKINDFYDEDVPSLPQLDESIRYFIISESIIIYKDNVEWKKHLLAGFAFTESLFLILKNEIDWLVCKTSEKHENDLTVEHEIKLVDLVGVVQIGIRLEDILIRDTIHISVYQLQFGVRYPDTKPSPLYPFETLIFLSLVQTPLFFIYRTAFATREDKRTTLVLHFVDERIRVEYFWHIKTGLGINEHVINLVNALWSPHYRLNLPGSRNAD